jgi:enoyl-CoA hydratase
MNYEFILVTPEVKKHIALIQLNRPKELNALNLQLMLELKDALQNLDKNDEVRCIIITGNQQAFAAGADIKQMESRTPVDLIKIDQFETWDQIRKTSKPVIAAVCGFALGGGCELAMTCDMIVAGESSKFGQPEIKIGIMPGAGGTQRLTRAVGKALAMEMVLTGKFISAEEAQKAGLINRVVPDEVYLDEAIKLASEVATMSPIALRLAKESVLKSFDSGLQEGLYFERKNFYLTFSSEDQKEGMNAFVEKRKANFSGN